MHKYTYRKFLAFTMAVMVAFTGCSKGSDTGNPSTAKESESTKDKASDRQKFDSYLNQLFKEHVNSNTVNLHYTLHIRNATASKPKRPIWATST